jgi:hypothetical protein
VRVVELTGERFERGERGAVVGVLPRGAQLAAHPRGSRSGSGRARFSPCALAALHDRAGAEHLADRLGQRLGAVDHHQHTAGHVEAAVLEIGEQRAGDGRVLGRALPQPER